MKAVNTYGMKMVGLKKASGSTQNYGWNSGLYDEVFYDKATGEIWTVTQVSLGHNSWTEYHDPNVIKICNTESHMTMQEMADAICKAVQIDSAMRQYC